MFSEDSLLGTLQNALNRFVILRIRKYIQKEFLFSFSPNYHAHPLARTDPAMTRRFSAIGGDLHGGPMLSVYASSSGCRSSSSTQIKSYYGSLAALTEFGGWLGCLARWTSGPVVKTLPLERASCPPAQSCLAPALPVCVLPVYGSPEFEYIWST